MTRADPTHPLAPPPDNPDLTLSLAKKLGLFFLVVSILGILFAGTFPFDFSIPPSLTLIRQLIHERFDWRWTEYDPGYIDRVENVLFFMPFGFALAAVLHARRAHWLVIFAGTFLLSLMLTSFIETSQVFISFRDPSLMDIRSNTFGGVIGATVYILIGFRLLSWTAMVLLYLRPLAKPQLLTIVLIAYSIVHLSAPLIIQNPGNLSSWDRAMPLVVGNELTSERPWTGSVSNIVLADRAASADEVANLFHGQSPSTTFGPSLLAEYAIHGKGPYPDLSNHLAAIEWFDNRTPTDAGDDQTPKIDADHWLKTPQPVTAAIDRIATTWQFTLALTASTADFDQRGPARIVSISSDTQGRDVQLGQEFNDLAVRVRTGTNRMPDLYLRDVFVDKNPHQIVITHKNAQIAMYIDGVEAGNVEVTPEAKVIWRLYPRGFRLHIERYGYRSYAAIYRLLVFIPFAALLGATLMLSHLSKTTKQFLAIAATVLMAITLELILGHESADGFQVKNLMISLVVGLGTIGILAWRRTRSTTPPTV